MRYGDRKMTHHSCIRVGVERASRFGDGVDQPGEGEFFFGVVGDIGATLRCKCGEDEPRGEQQT